MNPPLTAKIPKSGSPWNVAPAEVSRNCRDKEIYRGNPATPRNWPGTAYGGDISLRITRNSRRKRPAARHLNGTSTSEQLGESPPHRMFLARTRAEGRQGQETRDSQSAMEGCSALAPSLPGFRR